MNIHPQYMDVKAKLIATEAALAYSKKLYEDTLQVVRLMAETAIWATTEQEGRPDAIPIMHQQFQKILDEIPPRDDYVSPEEAYQRKANEGRTH